MGQGHSILAYLSRRAAFSHQQQSWACPLKVSRQSGKSLFPGAAIHAVCTTCSRRVTLCGELIDPAYVPMLKSVAD